MRVRSMARRRRSSATCAGAAVARQPPDQRPAAVEPSERRFWFNFVAGRGHRTRSAAHRVARTRSDSHRRRRAGCSYAGARAGIAVALPDRVCLWGRIAARCSIAAALALVACSSNATRPQPRSQTTAQLAPGLEGTAATPRATTRCQRRADLHRGRPRRQTDRRDSRRSRQGQVPAVPGLDPRPVRCRQGGDGQPAM